MLYKRFREGETRMNRMRFPGRVHCRIGVFGDIYTSGHGGRLHGRIMLLKGIVAVIATPVLAIALAPLSMAQDPAANLKSAIDAARSDAGCPAFQVDPLLTAVSQRSIQEVNAWVTHTGRVLPLSDTRVLGVPNLTEALRQQGYNPRKAKMLSGYGDYRTGGPGDNESKAITATVLQGEGNEVFGDCTYTKYGLSAAGNDGAQGWPSTPPRSFFVTAVTVAGD